MKPRKRYDDPVSLFVMALTGSIIIPLTRDGVSFIDQEDSHLSEANWMLNGCGYAKSASYGKHVTMHRMIMGHPEGKVDHRNGNRIDNRRFNLRVADNSQNACNRKTQRNNRCGSKGVRLHSRGLWQARIKIHGKSKHLGLFQSKEDAAFAYRRAAQQLHGEFSVIESRGGAS